MGISWSPLCALKGVKPPVKFGERTWDCSPGHEGKDGPHAIGQKALSHETRPKPSRGLPLRHRLRSVLLDLIKVGCKVVRHGGSLLLRFGVNCPNFNVLKGVYAMC